jgi:hypothetical protein
LLCIEIPAALRHFRVVILIQIGVERNERVIEKIALDPDSPRTRLGCRDSYLIDAIGTPLFNGYVDSCGPWPQLA